MNQRAFQLCTRWPCHHQESQDGQKTHSTDKKTHRFLPMCHLYNFTQPSVVLNEKCSTRFTKNPSLRTTFFLSASILLAVLCNTELCLFLPAQVGTGGVWTVSASHSSHPQPPAHTQHTHTPLTLKPVWPCNFRHPPDEGALAPPEAQIGRTELK